MCNTKHGEETKGNKKRQYKTHSYDGTGIRCDTWPEISLRKQCQKQTSVNGCGVKETYAFLCDGASDSRSLHFTLGVDYDTGVVLE